MNICGDGTLPRLPLLRLATTQIVGTQAATTKTDHKKKKKTWFKQTHKTAVREKF